MSGPRRAFITTSAARAVTVLLVAIRAKVVALTLGPEGVGLLGLFTAAQDIGAQAADAGLSHSAVREISRAQDRKERLARLRRALAVAVFFMAFLGAMAMWLASPVLSVFLTGSPLHSGAFACLAIGLFLTVLFRWRQALLTGYRQVGALALGGVLGSASATAVGIAAIWIWSWDGLVWAAIAAPAAGLGAYLVVGKVPRTGPVAGPLAPEWSILIRLGISLMLVAQIALIAPMALRVLLTHTGGLDDAGLFHAAWTVSAQIMAVLLVAVGVDFYPRISASIAVHADARATLDDQLRLHLAAGGPTLLLVAGTAPWVLSLLYSADFVPAAALLQGLAVGSLARLVSAPLETVLTAAGRPPIVLGLNLISLTLLLVGTILATPAFGLAAIGIAYSAAQFVQLGLTAIASHRFTCISPHPTAWLWLGGLTALAGGLTQLPSPVALGVAAVLAAGALTRTASRDRPCQATQETTDKRYRLFGDKSVAGRRSSAALNRLKVWLT